MFHGGYYDVDGTDENTELGFCRSKCASPWSQATAAPL